MSIKLSLCIPTYNRARFLDETLRSIVGQATENVEIVISDNASEDNTESVVEHYKKIFPRIFYHRQPQNMGADYNYLKVVELAHGEYCWLFGSDDLLHSGAINRILNEIDIGCGIYLCNRTECNSDLRPIQNQQWLSQTYNDHLFHFSMKSEWIEYFMAATSLGALFSYISAIIFNRKKWNEIRHDRVIIGTNYVHVFQLFSILKKGATLKYISAPLVLCRLDNDSFLSNGPVSRRLIDLHGYHLLATRLFFDDAEITSSFLSVLKETTSFWYLLNMKFDIRKRGGKDLPLLDQAVTALYADPLFRNRVYLLVYRWAPLPFYDLIYKIANRAKRFLYAR